MTPATPDPRPLTPQPPHDPWPNIFDLGTIALMNGSPNAGKTALLAAMLQRLNAGGDLFGFQVQPTPVFFIAMDRLWQKGASSWFVRYGFDIPHYSFVDDRTASALLFRNKTSEPAWDAYVNLLVKLALPAGTLIATDPYENAWGNVMDRGQVITASTVLQRHLDDAKLAQVGMMHSGKMKGDSSLNYANVHEQMAGSGALSGYSSAQITLLSPKQSTVRDSPLYELHVTAHCLPAMIIGLSRDKEGRFLIDQYIRLDEAAREQDAIPDLPLDQLKVLAAIPERPGLASSAIVEALKGTYERTKVFEVVKGLLTAQLIAPVPGSHGVYARTVKAKHYL